MNIKEDINRIKKIMGLLVEQPVDPKQNSDDVNNNEPESSSEEDNFNTGEYEGDDDFMNYLNEPKSFESTIQSFGYPVGEYPKCIGQNVICPGGTNGDWDGSLPMVLTIAKYTNLAPGSQKRWKKTTARGGISNHWCGRPYQYGLDLPTSGEQGDKNFEIIKQGLVKDGYLTQEQINVGAWKFNKGKYPTFTAKGFTCQVLWKSDSNHYDHIHIGCKNAAPTTTKESENCSYGELLAKK
jgi:hypothetical protein